jgi:hypothetical protein
MMKNQMTLTLATALVAAVAIAIAGGEAINSLVPAISAILPEGWTVTSSTNAVPYNLGIQPGRLKGTCLTFVGSVTVKGPRGINQEKESFVLWVMPPDYVPIEPETLAQFEEARLLGANNAMAVYWTSFTTGTPSWEHWQDDLARHLGITKAQPGAAPLPPAPRTGPSEGAR